MKARLLFTASLSLASGLFAAEVTKPEPAAPPPETAAAPTEAPPTLPRKPAYKPPKVGAPAVRVAGGSRGSDTEGVVLQALVPDHAALTFQGAPALYWYQSKPAKAR